MSGKACIPGWGGVVEGGVGGKPAPANRKSFVPKFFLQADILAVAFWHVLRSQLTVRTVTAHAAYATPISVVIASTTTRWGVCRGGKLTTEQFPCQKVGFSGAAHISSVRCCRFTTRLVITERATS